MTSPLSRSVPLSLAILSLASIVSIAAAGWAMASDGPERWVAGTATLLGLAWLGLCWPTHPRKWLPVVFFVVSCIFGAWVMIHSLAQRESSKMDAIALESFVFEASLMPLLTTNQCEAALSLLQADLEALPVRPALALVVRSDLWNNAAGRGCVTTKELAGVRASLRAHAQQAPLGAMGVKRETLLARIGLRQGLETVSVKD